MATLEENIKIGRQIGIACRTANVPVEHVMKNMRVVAGLLKTMDVATRLSVIHELLGIAVQAMEEEHRMGTYDPLPYMAFFPVFACFTDCEDAQVPPAGMSLGIMSGMVSVQMAELGDNP